MGGGECAALVVLAGTLLALFYLHVCLSDRLSMQEVRRIWVGYWMQCDPELGRKVKEISSPIQTPTALLFEMYRRKIG
jgi:hypothetical protein